jgi:autotransporter-associated beta strand protein
MISRLLFVFLGLSISMIGSAQTLTISSATQTASSGTTWQLSNNVLTVYGTSTINASSIVSWLGSSSLTIVGSTNAISVNVDANIISSAAGNGITIGNSNSNGTVTFNNTVNLMGALTVYAEKINLGSTVVQDAQSAQLIAGGSTGSISLYARDGFETLAWDGNTRGKIMTTGGGNIHINADTEQDNTGILNIDWLTIDGGTGNIILEGSSYSWNTGSNVTLPEFYGSGSFTFRNVPGANHTFNTAWIAIFGNFSGLTLGSNTGVEEILFAPCTVCDPSAKNYSNATWQIAGPINLYGSKVTIDLSLKSTLASSDILLKAKNSVIINANRSITSNNGDITFWSYADGVANSTDGDFIGIQNAVVINSANGLTNQSSGGGTITMAGGTTTQNLASGTVVPTDYAYSNRTTNWGPLLPPGGINFGFSTAGNGQQNSLSIYSGGGDIVIKGKSNSSSAGIQWFSGSTGATQIIHSGAGTILFDGIGTSTNAHGIELNSYASNVAPSITSSSSSSQAIKFVGETFATSGRAGFQGAATIIANSTGGGIEISGKTPSANTYGAVEAGGILTYALTGPITFIGDGSGGLKIGGTWGKGSLPSSSSNITIRSNVFTLNTPTIQTSGAITVEPFGTSFTNAISFPITNLSLPNTITGLALGKSGNTANITVASATSVLGAINIYGGALALNANVSTSSATTGGDILLQGSTLSGTGNLSLASNKVVSINVSTASTYDGIISGTGSGLTKLGAGLLTLTKAHTYSGVTSIDAGDLQVGTGGSVSQASSGTIAASSEVVVASGSKLILSPNQNVTFSAPISGAGGIEIKGASGTYYNATYLSATPVTIASNSTVLEVLTRLTGGIQQGSAIVGSQTCAVYQKVYNAATNTATLQFQQYEGQYTKCVFAQLSQSGSNVQIRANTSIYGGAAYRTGNDIGQDLSINSSQMGLASAANGNAGYGISSIFMSGKVNFTGALSYTGNTTLSSVTTTSPTSPFVYSYTSKGTQEITDASSSFPSASTVVNNGLVIFNRSSALAIASPMNGTEEVLQVGAAITLTGACTHSGLTTIDLNKSLLIGAGSTTGSMTGNIQNYGTLTFNRSDNSSYPGVISGTGTLVKNGAGEHTLTNLQTFTGTTTINAGKLIISRDVPAFPSSSISGAGELVIQPTSASFTNAVSYPISGITVGSIGGLTLGKSGNLANITFASNTSIAGPISALGGTISVNANLTSTLNGAAILLQGSKVVHGAGIAVQTLAGNITYTATNSPWTVGSDQCILVGINSNSTLATINAQGGHISLSGSFATTGVTNTSITPNPDVAVMFYNSKLQTSGSGTITINGNSINNESVNSHFIWGVMFERNTVLQTQNGNISVTGRPGNLNANGRGIVADGVTNLAVLKVLSETGTIQFTESMPVGHSNNNYTGAYFKPSTTAGTVQFGADGSSVVSSSSNIIFDVDRISFEGTNPTVFNTTGTVTIQPISDSFKGAVSFANISAPSITGLTIGKTGNTANIAMESATSINGPITIFGGTLALNNALTTTNTSTGNLSLNGTTLSGSSTLTVANGRTLTMNLSSNTNYAGLISGTSLNLIKDGAGTLTLPTPTALSFAAMTISGGAYTLNANQQLTLTGALTNNGTFTMKDGATFVQGTGSTSIAGTGTYNVEKALTDNLNPWSTTTGRFWYMGVPMVSVARSSYGTPGTTTNRVWSYSEATKSYTELTASNDLLSAGTGYVHRRSTDGTLTFSATGANGLYGSDYSVSGLTKTAGYTSGVNLVSNPYMGYLDWNAVYNASTNIDPTFYIRSNNTTSNNINALISYNGSTQLYTNTSSVTINNASQIRYIAPMQSVWVKVGAAASTGTVNMTRSMLSHQTGNSGLKSSTVFPTLAKVNLVDGNNFDQLLVYMNSDMSNEVDQYDSEKLLVSGTVQVYTMASNKKLVMNGLKNNKKKVSVPLYLELPASKSYTLQLSEYVIDNGLILLEDKQEGTMQDFTLLGNYTFYANSGTLQNRFVLHFILPDAEFTTQGPSNSWVGPETSYTEGGNVQITNDERGNIQITVDQPEDQKVEGNVCVTDMNGKEVYKGQLDGITTAFELNVPAGIYYLTVQSGALFEKKKVFIQE